MRRLGIWVFFLCFSGHVVAQSDQADLRASCNASFHEGCKTVASSSGFAAPAGELGSSVLEAAMVVLLIAGGISRRYYRHAVGGARKRNRHGRL